MPTAAFDLRSLGLLIGLCLFACPAVSLAQRELTNIPDPDPELERQTFLLDDGLEVNLFAADPLIAKPIQINFDHQGRLWIASSEVYPQIKPGQKADDKILVLEDADGDGRAEKARVFADGLLIPTGVLPGDGGVYVANSTELIHLSDTDGDGRADRRRIVLSGFGTEDTHHLLHTLRWGHDGCMYMNQSIYIHSHVETPHGVKRLNGGGIWRFRPETMELEVFCRGFVNAWGHHFDAWGQSFATDGAYGEGINYVFPGSVFVTAVGAKRRVMGLNPGSPKHCGLEIISGRHFPEDWSGSMVTSDFRGHRVCRFVVSEASSGYASKQAAEIVKTTHVAFRPIDAKIGPDGALYIADWYNPIIQHGEVDFRDPRRDQTHGRIWRVTYKGRPLVTPPKLEGASDRELLDMLKLPEEGTRLHAKLLLKPRPKERVLAELDRWLAGLDASDPRYEHHRLEGLWVAQTLDAPRRWLLDACLASSDHRVRAAAMRVASLWQRRLDRPLAIFASGVADSHPRVRLEAVRALAETQSPQAAEIAARALRQPMDDFLDFALWQTMRDLEPYWLPALRDGQIDFDGDVDQLSFAMQAIDTPGVVAPLVSLAQKGKLSGERLDRVLSLIASLGGEGELGFALGALLADGGDLTTARRAALLQTLVDTSARRKLRPTGDLARLARLFQQSDDALRIAAAKAAGAWQVEPLRATLTDWASGAVETQPAVRQAAIEAVAAFGGSASVATLTSLAKAPQPFDVRRQAVIALAANAPQAAAREAVALFGEWPSEADPAEVVTSLVQRRGGPEALVKALEGRSLPTDTAKQLVSAARAAGQPSPVLIEAIQQAGRLQDAGWKLSPEEVAKLVTEVARHGDPARGEAIYRRQQLQCQKCHAIGGAGGLVGPDLVSIGASAQVDYLIESLIEPNKKIKEGYHAQQIATDEGLVLAGIVIRETDNDLVLRDAEGRETVVQKDAIEVRQDSRSLMPDGLVDSLTRSELVDLTRFLSELGKLGPYSVSKRPLVRQWQSLVWTQEGHRRLNRTSYDTAATDDPALTWEAATSRVSGELPIDVLPPFVVHADLDPTAFVRFEFNLASPGQVKLAFNSTDGLSLWMDGRPADSLAEPTFDLDRGRHQVTLAINKRERSQPLVVELIEAGEGKENAAGGE